MRRGLVWWIGLARAVSVGGLLVLPLGPLGVLLGRRLWLWEGYVYLLRRVALLLGWIALLFGVALVGGVAVGLLARWPLIWLSGRVSTLTISLLRGISAASVIVSVGHLYVFAFDLCEGSALDAQGRSKEGDSAAHAEE